MGRMSQLPLFSATADFPGVPRSSRRANPNSEQLLTEFRDARLAQGASPQSVRREMSQLRAVIREAGTMDQPAGLGGIFDDLGLVAHGLREPERPIARTTGRARLVAV